MRRVMWWAVAVVLVACEPNSSLLDVKPLQLSLAGPASVRDDGRPIELTATVTLSRGVATGNVTFTSTAGHFEPETRALADGVTSSVFTCDVLTDARCTGRLEVTATWGALEGRRTISVQPVRVPDAGTPDAGMSDGGTTDAGTTDAGTTDAGEGAVWVVSPLANTADQQSVVAQNLDGHARPFLFPRGATNVRVRGTGFIYQNGGQVFEAIPDDWSVYASGDAGGNDVLLPTVCAPLQLETSADGRWAYTCASGDGGVFDGWTGLELVPQPSFAAFTPLGVFSFISVNNLPSNALFRSSAARYDGDGGVYFGAWLFADRQLELHHVSLTGVRTSTVVGRYVFPDAGYDPYTDATTIGPNLSVWITIRSANEIWEAPLEPGQPRLVFRLDSTLRSQPLSVPPVLYPQPGAAGLISNP